MPRLTQRSGTINLMSKWKCHRSSFLVCSERQWAAALSYHTHTHIDGIKNHGNSISIGIVYLISNWMHNLNFNLTLICLCAFTLSLFRHSSGGRDTASVFPRKINSAAISTAYNIVNFHNKMGNLVSAHLWQIISGSVSVCYKRGQCSWFCMRVCVCGWGYLCVRVVRRFGYA